MANYKLKYSGEKIDEILTKADGMVEVGTATGETAGKVTLSDSINETFDASSGVAATPKAVKAAYDAVKAAYDASVAEVNQLKDDLTAEQTARANADQALANDIGDAWSSSTTYAVGDYAISGNRLYKCKTEHTAGSAFSAEYWDAVSLAGEIKSASNNAQKVSFPFTPTRDGILIVSCENGGAGTLINTYKANNVTVFRVESGGARISGCGFFRANIQITKISSGGRDHLPTEYFIYL